jgi:hypothetical protein
MTPRALALLAVLALPASALAFTFESALQGGCHERITRAAAEASPWPDGVEAPAPTRESTALADAMAFTTAGADVWTVAMMVGVRDVDLRGATPVDMPELAAIHNSKDHQDQHCLRATDDDGAEGDARALAACQAFILDEVALALGDSDEVDPGATEDVLVGLWLAQRRVPLSRYAFHLGRAAHALQDSYAHGFRDDEHHVMTLFNYVEPQLASYAPSRDGHAHLGTWDGCDDEVSQGRVQGATDATAALLRALAAPGTKAERLARASTALDQWLRPAAGCDGDNGWCAARIDPVGCSAAGGGPLALLLPLVVLGLRRSRRGLAGALAVCTVLAASVARAADDVPASTVATGDATPRASLPAATASDQLRVTALAATPETPRRGEVHLTVGGAVDRGAAAFGVGASLRVSRRFALGIDLEFGPWFDLLTKQSGTGTVRAYAIVSFIWADFGTVLVRSAAELGASVLLFDVPGARAGSVGLVLGASVLNVAWYPLPRVSVEVVPDVLLDVPSLHGVPLVYKEYRLLGRVGWRF